MTDVQSRAGCPRHGIWSLWSDRVGQLNASVVTDNSAVGRGLLVLRTVATFACILGVTGSNAFAQVAKMYPVDEAAEDPEFFVFRSGLLVALQRRDVDFLYGILDPHILNSFGGDGGVDEFKTRWKPEEPTSEIWVSLTEVLALGGQFQPPTEWSGSRTFTAPYTFSVKPTAGSDPYLYGVIIGRGVRVRQEPSQMGPILASLSFDVVRVTNWDRRLGSLDDGAISWTEVQLADGRSGYVASEFVRNRNGYRAIFVTRNGRWFLRALVAGD